MGSAGVCSALSLYMLLKYSWRSFKLLKSQNLRPAPCADTKNENPAGLGVNNAENVKVNATGAYSSAFTSVPERKAELVFLLQFWTIYSVLTLYEYYFEFILAFVPFYYFVKFGFLLYINIPQTRGVTIIFETVVRPYILRAEHLIHQVLLPPLRVLPNTLENSTIPCLSLYRLEATIEYMERLLVKLQDERSRRLAAIEFQTSAQIANPGIPGPAKAKVGKLQNAPEVELLTEHEQLALNPAPVDGWTAFVPGMMKSVIGLTVHTKDMISQKLTVKDVTSADLNHTANETPKEMPWDANRHLRSIEVEVDLPQSRRSRKRSVSNVSESSSGSSGSSSGKLYRRCVTWSVTLELDSSGSSSSEGEAGALGRYKMIEKSMGEEGGKYKEGFSSLRDYEEDSPTKSGAVYMDSVIKMMKGVDTAGSQTKRVLTFEQ